MQGQRPRPSAQEGSATDDHLYSFDVQVTQEAGRIVVAPVGELDVATCEALEHRVAGLLTDEVHVVMDLSRLLFIDVAGMRSVLRCAELARRGGVRFSVALGSPRIRRPFELSGALDQLVPVYDSVAGVPE